MPKFKFIILAAILMIITAGCDLKINFNSNSDQSDVQVWDNNEQADANEENNGQKSVDFTFDTSKEGVIKQVLKNDTKEVWIDDLTMACESDVMMFAQPADSEVVILSPFNPGSDKPISSLFLLNLKEKECAKLGVSIELSDFGARVISPDQSKLAVALETNEAKILKVLDLIADEAKIVVTLGEGETLNGGYGALSNHFNINWLDDSKIQYSVYQDTYKDYAIDAPESLEKVIEVRIAALE